MDSHISETNALVAVGSNMSSDAGGPLFTVKQAVRALEARCGCVAQLSRFYRTPAYPAESGADFVNAALLLPWSGSAEDLLAHLHAVEAEFGRTRSQRWEARVLDLDLLALGAQVSPDADLQTHWRGLSLEEAASRTPDRLILPHPRLQDRGFVLVPLHDVEPDWCHPLTGLSVAEMLAALPPEQLQGIEALAENS